jgi:soluble lytic murein transglycosylase-like protein
VTIHRIRIARAVAGALVLALSAGTAQASSLSDLIREYRAADRASVDAGPPIAADEAARLWDAFLTAIVKRAGRDTAVEGLRDDLFAALLADRYQVVGQALEGDGARWLSQHFEEAWPRIEPVLSLVAAELPAAQAQAYRELVASGNLLALAQRRGIVGERGVAPAGLRKLAQKVITPAEGDPLAWSADVDPELRAVFGFDAALPDPQVSPLLPDAAPTAFLQGPLGLVARIATGAADWVVPTAHAATSGWDWHTLVTRLNDWVPSGKREMRDYLPMVQEMLDGTAHTLAARRLPPEHFDVYRDLVVATAWQESCWRQYTKRAGKVQTLRGPGGTGLMQVNTRVWRGIYDPSGVATDIGYNGRAGAEILYQYMRKHAIRGKEHLAPGGETNLARATWAAYNGGPGHLRRYRKPNTSAHLRAVDAEFFQKFQAVENDDESAFFSCAVKG